jgi:acetoin utilization deacetylase AcuC-like enzyme
LLVLFETLNRAHSKNYINDIKNKTLDKNGIKKIGFPLVDSVVQRSLVATGGTVLASKLALNYGLPAIRQGAVIMLITMKELAIVFLMM